MNNNGNGFPPVQGTEETKKVFTPEQVREFVKRDVNAAILLLESIYRDVDTLNAVSDYLHGRYLNAKHKEELSKQQELDLKV